MTNPFCDFSKNQAKRRNFTRSELAASVFANRLRLVLHGVSEPEESRRADKAYLFFTLSVDAMNSAALSCSCFSEGSCA